jgi:cbb3-type cytochrome oxidase subunit 3
MWTRSWHLVKLGVRAVASGGKRKGKPAQGPASIILIVILGVLILVIIFLLVRSRSRAVKEAEEAEAEEPEDRAA